MSEPYDQQIQEGVQEAEQAAQEAHDVIARIHQYAARVVWEQESPAPASRRTARGDDDSST